MRRAADRLADWHQSVAYCERASNPVDTHVLFIRKLAVRRTNVLALSNSGSSFTLRRRALLQDVALDKRTATEDEVNPATKELEALLPDAGQVDNRL